MENHIDHPLTVTVAEAAKLLGIGRSTAYELVHTGDIPSLRLGRRLVVPVAQIAVQLGLSYEAMLAVLTTAEVPAPAASRDGAARLQPGHKTASPTLF